MAVAACLGKVTVAYDDITIEQACQQLAAGFGSDFYLWLEVTAKDGEFRAVWIINATDDEEFMSPRLADAVNAALTKTAASVASLKRAEELVDQARVDTALRDHGRLGAMAGSRPSRPDADSRCPGRVFHRGRHRRQDARRKRGAVGAGQDVAAGCFEDAPAHWFSCQEYTPMDTLERTGVRWMICRDMDQLLAIDQASFGIAWTREDFLECMRTLNRIGIVAERGEQVLGYMIYDWRKTSLRMLGLAVDPACRRQGVGRKLVARLVEKVAHGRHTHIALKVREHNLAAQMFFQSCGFRATTVLRGYYRDPARGRLLHGAAGCQHGPQRVTLASTVWGRTVTALPPPSGGRRMTATLLEPTDVIDVAFVPLLIFGPPGSGKTTLAQTTDSPLTLDFDQGIHRCANRRRAYRFDAWATACRPSARASSMRPRRS
jgi:ribosomal-protein-alanine N-acetyltransferase